MPLVFMTRRFLTAPVRYRQTIMKRNSLPLVCKEWYHTAMDLLYEEVHLRSLWQLFKFIESLETSGHDRRGLVKDLVIETLTPALKPVLEGEGAVDDNDDRVFLKSRTSVALFSIIHRICLLCPNISTLSYFPNGDQDKNPFDFFFEGNLCQNNSISTIPKSLLPDAFPLRELRLGQEASHLLSGHSLSQLKTLEVLEIHLDSLSFLSAVKNVDLPNLKWFRCLFNQGAHIWSSTDISQAMRVFATTFAMPRLESLTILVDLWWHYTRGSSHGHLCEDLIKAHKERLVYLCLVGIKSSSSEPELAKILQETTRLRHLVIDDLGIQELDSNGSWIQRSLEYIDVWCSFTGKFVHRIGSVDTNITTTKFPALKCPPRMFDMGLIHTRASADLPTFILPGDGGVRYPGLTDIGVTSDGRIVYKNDFAYVDDRWDWNRLVPSNGPNSSTSPVSMIFDVSDEDDLDYQWEDVSSTHSAEDYESDADSLLSVIRSRHR
ncbi:hypothetical protein AAF712_010818 [Marasmius tenuissimus]|uniref:F-box domain-containing protein n=1 Tax=Marasmius tenuissimus TaxID=585030 RepID=A0ABR2ZN31_9AGAR